MLTPSSPPRVHRGGRRAHRARRLIIATLAAAFAALAALTGAALPAAAAPTPPDCAWQSTAQQLADELAGVTDPSATNVLAALRQAGVTPRGRLPAACRSAVPQGGTEVCDKFGRAPVDGGRYIVQNNQWGPDAPQCVTAFSNGFTVDSATGASDSMPVAYPSIFYGCHYGCTADSGLPRQSTALGDLRTSWSVNTPDSGDWNAAYDIWFDPTPRTDGTVTGTEMMIWLDRRGRPQPLGSKVDTVTLAGTSWDVWFGENGAKVVSYVRSKPTHSVQDMALQPFIDDAAARGALDKSWYLTSIQAGFEPWSGGAGLATTAFSVTGALP